MTTLILTIAVIVGLVGICVAVWSFFNTRNKYYSEYVERKKK